MKKKSAIAKTALTVFLGGFYPLFVFFAGYAFESEEGLLLDRPIDSRYGNRIAEHVQDSGKNSAVSVTH